MRPGNVAKYDYEYERKGTANLFVMCQPLTGWREVKATDRRAKVDFAHCMKGLVDVHFPEAEVIRIVLDGGLQHLFRTGIAVFQVVQTEPSNR